jgi:hypothetical protein
MSALARWAMNLPTVDPVKRDALDVLRDLIVVAAVYADDPELAPAVTRLAMRAQQIVARSEA